MFCIAARTVNSMLTVLVYVLLAPYTTSGSAIRRREERGRKFRILVKQPLFPQASLMNGIIVPMVKIFVFVDMVNSLQSYRIVDSKTEQFLQLSGSS